MLSLMIHKSFFFSKKEIWFYNGQQPLEAAYTTYSYSLKELNTGYEKRIDEQTTFIDLKQTETTLFSSLRASCRNEIHRADKLGIQYTCITEPDIKCCKKVIAGFNRFAKSKKIPKARSRRIYSLQKNNSLIISEALQNEKVICTHVYLHNRQRILLMSSFHDTACDDKKLKSIANRSLHWHDMMQFKKMGFTIYDFGGINAEKTPGITRFKLGFGGAVTRVYNYTRVTPLLKPLYRLYTLAFSLNTRFVATLLFVKVAENK